MDHSTAVSAWATLGAATFPLLFLVSAPYGKLVRGGWGAQLDGRIGWFIQEIISPVTLTLAYLYGARAGVFTFDGAGAGVSTFEHLSWRHQHAQHAKTLSTPPPLTYIFVVLWWCHYLNRAVVYPMTRHMSNTTLPVVAMVGRGCAAVQLLECSGPTVEPSSSTSSSLTTSSSSHSHHSA
jgi:3-oxo-5-alpha-steroid 4-dehydrogenase 1